MPPARRSAPTTSAACCARRTCSTPARSTPPVRSTPPSCAGSRTRRSRDVVRMQADVGLRTATDGEFRRASWHMDFIYAIGGITKVTDQNIVVHFQNADGTMDFTPAGLHVDGPLSDRRADLRARLRVPAVGGGGRADGEADHPLAVDGPLPRRRGGHRSRRLSRRGLVLGGALGGLQPTGPGHRRAGLHVPAVRRHQPGLPQRPRAAGGARRAGPRRRAPARALHPPDQQGAGRPPGRADGHHPHVPRQLPLVVGGRGRLRLRRRGPVRRAGGRRVLPRVRRRPVRRVRAAAVRAARASASSWAW